MSSLGHFCNLMLLWACLFFLNFLLLLSCRDGSCQNIGLIDKINIFRPDRVFMVLHTLIYFFFENFV